MNLPANTGGNHFRNGIRRISGKAIKFNKQTTEYVSTSAECEKIFNSVVFRLEHYRGFSKAEACQYVFTVKDQPTWNKSSRISCLFPTKQAGIYVGDKREGKLRTMFFVDIRNSDSIQVYVLPKGSNPKAEVNQIAAGLC